MSFQSDYLLHMYSGFEPSQAFDVVYGGRFEHRLLSSECATMEHQRLTLGDVRLETGFYDFPVIAQGSMPPNAICIGFVAHGSEVTRYNTASIGDDEIQVYLPDAGLLYHAMASSRWVNFVVSEERLQRVAMERAGRPLKLPKAKASSIRLLPGGRSTLACLANDALGVARTLEHDGGIPPDLASTIRSALLDGYADALFDAGPAPKGGSTSAAQRHHHLIMACERLVMSDAEADLTPRDIARLSGYGLRSLELIFQRGVGMTPGRWFLNARLNGALRDLLVPGSTCTVSDVAAKWGFRHLSRFAQYYRRAFGESPSDTLRRSRE